MWGIRRLRFATGVDDDLRPFHEAYRDDPLIGRAVRADPELRVRRAPLPWEALAAAITEQLIEFERAVAIQRRLIAALGHRCPRDRAARRAAARDGRRRRARAARRDGPRARRARSRCAAAAAEVAAGRADLLAADPMPGWRRLRAIPGIGPWTLEMLALPRPGPPRPRPGRRPRLPQARRPDHDRPPEGPRRPRRRCASSSRRTASGRGSPASTRWPRPRGRRTASASLVLLERAPRVEPLARQELVRQHPLRGLRLREQLLVEHPVDVGLPLLGVLPAPRLASRPRGRRPGASRRPRPPAGRGRAPGRPRAARRSPAPGPRAAPRAPCPWPGGSGGRARRSPGRGRAAGRRRRARSRSARRGPPCAGSPGPSCGARGRSPS